MKLNTVKENTNYQKLNDIWMHKDTSGEPMQDPALDNHWVLNVGDVVVEATTREGCLEMAKRGQNSLKAEVLDRDIKKYGGSQEDLQRLEKLKNL